MINAEELDDYYDNFIKDKMYPDPADYNLSRQEMKNLSTYDWDRKKFKKRKKEEKKIKTGDTVVKSGIVAKVEDIDGDLVCVKVDGQVEIWNIKDVRKVDKRK